MVRYVVPSPLQRMRHPTQQPSYTPYRQVCQNCLDIDDIVSQVLFAMLYVFTVSAILVNSKKTKQSGERDSREFCLKLWEEIPRLILAHFYVELVSLLALTNSLV